MSKTKYIVFTAGVHPVSAARLRQVITDCVNQRYDELHFLISSGGGDVFEGLSLAALIYALPMKTVMHNIGQVNSVSTAIFSAGKERLSNKEASFMFHGVTTNIKEASFLEQQLKEIYDNSRKMKADITKAISTYISLPMEKVEALMVDGGSTISAEEAKVQGFISEISEAKIPKDADMVSISNN